MESLRFRRSSRRKAGIAAIAVSIVLASGCSSGIEAAPGRIVAVTLRDFKLSASARSIPAGRVRLMLYNRGPSTHELVVVRTDRAPDSLPILPDGLTVDEEAASLRLLDEDSDIAIGATDALNLRLRPGRYVLFCNLNGHYLGVMHVSLVVT